MKRLLLIDGDILVYETAASLEVPTDWGDDFWTLHCDAKAAKEQMVASIEAIKNDLKADEMIFALSNYDNPFRKLVLPSYKSNRKTVRKPVVWGEMRAYLKEHYVWKEKPGLEGDDILGILATKPWFNRERIIVTIDKDLLTIPGLHYNMRKTELGVLEVTQAQADKMHMIQTLTGDPTDGYKGCPKVGKVGAEKILGDCEPTYAAMWPHVVKAYAAAGLSEEVALQQARVARILRAEDWDFKNERVKLWEPKL